MKIKKIVLTGGPCSGKTTVLRALEEEFAGQIMVVPEVATMILSSGFPMPGRDVEWSEEWQAAFQSAVYALQLSVEKTFSLMAEGKNTSLLICDRGLLDGAAYTPGGLNEFARKYKVNADEALKEYAAVIHLESMATHSPENYGKANNENRFEPLERAQELEHATRAAWDRHPSHQVVRGHRHVDEKIAKVINIVNEVLAN